MFWGFVKSMSRKAQPLTDLRSHGCRGVTPMSGLGLLGCFLIGRISLFADRFVPLANPLNALIATVSISTVGFMLHRRVHSHHHGRSYRRKYSVQCPAPSGPGSQNRNGRFPM